MYGLSNNPNVNIVALPADGAGSATTISSKTAQQQLRDLNAVATATTKVSKHTFVADTLLVPTTVWDAIQTTYVNPSYNTDTVYRAFLENQKLQNGITTITCVPPLDTAGPGGTPMMIAYKKDDSVLHYVRSAGIHRRPWIQSVRGVGSALLGNSGGIAIKQGVGVTYAYNV
jgi:hypothetical protein